MLGNIICTWGEIFNQYCLISMSWAKGTSKGFTLWRPLFCKNLQWRKWTPILYPRDLQKANTWERKNKITQHAHILLRAWLKQSLLELRRDPTLMGLRCQGLGSRRLFIAEFLSDASRIENRLHWLDSWNVHWLCVIALGRDARDHAMPRCIFLLPPLNSVKPVSDRGHIAQEKEEKPRKPRKPREDPWRPLKGSSKNACDVESATYQRQAQHHSTVCNLSWVCAT